MYLSQPQNGEAYGTVPPIRLGRPLGFALEGLLRRLLTLLEDHDGGHRHPKNCGAENQPMRVHDSPFCWEAQAMIKAYLGEMKTA
jgi:hypothetical protein